MLKRTSQPMRPGTAPVAPRTLQRKQEFTILDEQQARPQVQNRLANRASDFEVAEYPQRRKFGALLAFLLLVALPTVLAGYYYSRVATPQYVSEMHFGVRSVEAAKNDATSIFQGMAAASQIGLDSYMVIEFIKSRAMLEYLEGKVDFGKIYSAPTVDWLSRLPAGATVEDRVLYWRRHVEPYFDLTTGSMSVKLRSFDPETARQLNELILERAGKLVNETSQNARNDSLKIAQGEVDRAEARLRKSVQAIQVFRDAAGSINPNREAESGLKGLESMQQEITRAKAQLAVQMSYLDASSPAVVATQRRISALAAQLKGLKSELTTNAGTGSGNNALSADIGQFDTLSLEQKFAEEQYTSAMAAMERAKLQAERQVSYLSVFIRPTAPSSSTYPDAYQSTAIAFAASFAFWILGFILFKSVREK